MKIFECKCGSKEIFIKENGNNKGLYCAECGKWIRWLSKDDLRLAQRQIEQSIVNPIPRNLDELKEHDREIYNKAIDDFTERLKPIIDEKIKGWTNSDDLRRWCERSIDEIAEQLKVGGKNERKL